MILLNTFPPDLASKKIRSIRLSMTVITWTELYLGYLEDQKVSIHTNHCYSANFQQPLISHQFPPSFRSWRQSQPATLLLGQFPGHVV